MGMKKAMDFFTGSDGKSQIAYYIYAPTDREPVGIVQISHGMCEYIERYEPLAEYLCERGVVLCGNDHLGHGATAPSAEEYGFFAEEDGVRYLISDLHKMTTLVKQEFPSLPLFLVGHSMGSFLARAYLTRYGEELQGAIIVGTSGGNPLLKTAIRLADRAAKKHGGHYRSNRLNRLAFQTYNDRTERRTDYDWLCKDIFVVDRYIANERCTFVFTAAGFRDLFTVLDEVSDKEWAENCPKDLPMLLMAGEEDPVGDYGKGVRKVACRLIDAQVTDLSLRMYPDCRHEIFNEPEKEEIFSDLYRWMMGKLEE